VRDTLADSLAGRDGRTLHRLANDLETAVRRRALADPHAPPRVLLAGAPERGPWLGYLLGPDGSSCWLALGWSPPGEAAAVRGAFPLEVDDPFRLGPIDAVSETSEALAGTVLSVEYLAASLPPEHRLLNDLHAMVMLHDLLSERAGAAQPAPSSEASRARSAAGPNGLPR
jgi:hypothetical protein